MKFALVDRVTELAVGQSIKASKNLTLAEEYLADHFPGFPVMPGVLMLEALVQTGAWLMRASSEFQYSTVLLKECRAVRYNNFVKPGDTLHLEMTVKKKSEIHWDFIGAGTVNGGSAVNARLSLVQLNLADRNPEMVTSDAERIAYFRSQWGQIYSPVRVVEGSKLP